MLSDFTHSQQLFLPYHFHVKYITCMKVYEHNRVNILTLFHRTSFLTLMFENAAVKWYQFQCKE